MKLAMENIRMAASSKCFVACVCQTLIVTSRLSDAVNKWYVKSRGEAGSHGIMKKKCSILIDDSRLLML